MTTPKTQYKDIKHLNDTQLRSLWQAYMASDADLGFSLMDVALDALSEAPGVAETHHVTSGVAVITDEADTLWLVGENADGVLAFSFDDISWEGPVPPVSCGDGYGEVPLQNLTPERLK